MEMSSRDDSSQPPGGRSSPENGLPTLTPSADVYLAGRWYRYRGDGWWGEGHMSVQERRGSETETLPSLS